MKSTTPKNPQQLGNKKKNLDFRDLWCVLLESLIGELDSPIKDSKRRRIINKTIILNLLRRMLKINLIKVGE